MKLQTLKGLGENTASKFAALGIYSVEDLLFYLPFRYQDRTRITPIRYLQHGEDAVIEGEILASGIKFGKRRTLIVTLQDNTGFIELQFYYFNKSQQEQLKPGVKLRCYGEPRVWKNKLMIIHPEYRRVDEHNISTVEETLTPVYPKTEGLSQTTFFKFTTLALAHLKKDDYALELLTQAFREQYSLVDIKQAIIYVHRPPPEAPQELLMEKLHPLQQRLAFEELLAHQVGLRQLRAKIQLHRATPLTKKGELETQFLKALPFDLTKAQKTVWQEINNDLKQPHPMMRLVQGDVGSGKTVVAALAGLRAIENGFQAAIMAPTEILAEQHYQNFLQWFEPLDIKVVWLTGKLKAKERRETLALIESGEAQFIVGTHALFQKEVNFHQLSLVIIDEQHRFGVAQRQALREKGIEQNDYPHQLIMTATPIPRTLAMTVYADLDTSIIDELPPGRTPIKTILVNNQRRAEVIDRAKIKCEKGGQAYWVCPLIETSETLQCETAQDTLETLQKALPTLNIGMIHGRLKSDEKDRIMHAFKAKEIDILVATTVIEVGVNVPNATLMIIENAERMGLAQLHQLRGRVGRGDKESHCVLLYQEPLSEIAKKRLTTMRESTDGFYIAQQDLELRGPGEVMGTRQTGMQRLRIADIMRDRKLLPTVQKAAQVLLKDYPEIVEPLKQRWLGDNEILGNV
jgi:ATP-dependent DNA helicase RecG